MYYENIEKQMEFVDACKSPVLAYCASGTRCTVAWALAQVGKMSKVEILKTTRMAGYNLDGIFQT